jgi:hypothetical protein
VVLISRGTCLAEHFPAQIQTGVWPNATHDANYRSLFHRHSHLPFSEMRRASVPAAIFCARKVLLLIPDFSLFLLANASYRLEFFQREELTPP